MIDLPNIRSVRGIGSASVAENRREISYEEPSRVRTISMISEQLFELEVLGNFLRTVFPDARIRSFETADDWERAGTADSDQETVLYALGERSIADAEVKTALRNFVASAGQRRVIVISRSNDLMATFDVIDCGACSYIPPNVGLDELVDAIRSPLSKSVVIPRQWLKAVRDSMETHQPQQPGLERHFTERQLAVALALQRGAANKTIAYELGLCESTVKVHIRNIMRKLRATNRTQASFRLNELASGQLDASSLATGD